MGSEKWRPGKVCRYRNIYIKPSNS
jgi:hypothetical protein